MSVSSDKQNTVPPCMQVSARQSVFLVELSRGVNCCSMERRKGYCLFLRSNYYWEAVQRKYYHLSMFSLSVCYVRVTFKKIKLAAAVSVSFTSINQYINF